MKISLPPTSLDYQKIIEAPKPVMWIDLGEETIEYYVRFWAEEPVVDGDPISGTKKAGNHINIIALKESVASIVMCNTSGPSSGDNFWKIVIFINGSDEDIKIFFYDDQFKEAKELLEEIKLWRYGTAK